MSGTTEADDPLLGRWGHSYEEDHDGVRVYRREDYAYPPARGRAGIEFRGDGTYVDWVVGPADARQPVTGSWRRAGGAGVRITTSAGDDSAVEVLSLEPDRLELRRVEQP